MPREITTHHTNQVNQALRLTVVEDDETNEPYSYLLRWLDKDGADDEVELPFHHTPIGEVGSAKGLTNEVLLAILRDRLEHFQRGQFACEENASALEHVLLAADYLENRTKRRTEQGVEGTSEPDRKP
jgi:hypothetical protein